MEHAHHVSSEISHHHAPADNTKRIWRTFWVLLFLTIGELALGFAMYAISMPGWMHLFFKGVIVILTLAKAYYIIAIFMHLGDEIRNLIMTIAIPCLLFIWFITAFLIDGNSFRQHRNKYDAHFRESTIVNKEQKADTTMPGLK